MNKKNFIQYIVSTLIILVIFSGCTESIDMDFKSEEPQLVVDGFLTDQEKNHFVILTKTTDFLLNEEPPAVSGAIISITDGENEIILNELEEYPGFYLIPATYRGVHGKTYTLNISGVDINEDGTEETYQASNKMALPLELNSINLEWSLAQGEKSWHIEINAKEREETKDFYAFAAHLNDDLIDDQISELEYFEDKYFNGNNLVDWWAQSIVEEESDGEVTEYILEVGDWVILDVYSINEDFYDFIHAVNEETGIKIPLFSGPPANVPTNISNNARGFFRVYSVSTDSIQVTQEILNQRN